MLLVGILVAVVSLPVLTLPAALAAGVRHLRRYLKAEDSGLEWFWRDVRSSILGGIGIGAASVVIAAVLALDIDLAGSGVLPGGPIVGVVGWLGLAALVLVLFTAAGRWAPGLGWLGALKGVPAAVRDDPAGCGLPRGHGRLRRRRHLAARAARHPGARLHRPRDRGGARTTAPLARRRGRVTD